MLSVIIQVFLNTLNYLLFERMKRQKTMERGEKDVCKEENIILLIASVNYFEPVFCISITIT